MHTSLSLKMSTAKIIIIKKNTEVLTCEREKDKRNERKKKRKKERKGVGRKKT